MKVRYTDKFGRNISEVGYEHEDDAKRDFPNPHNPVKHRGNTAFWNNKATKIVSVFYRHDEVVIQLDCEKVIPVLKAVKPKPTVRRKKKVVVPIALPAVEEVKEVKVEEEVKPKKKRATKKKVEEAA